jgi:hypothetical protein
MRADLAKRLVEGAQPPAPRLWAIDVGAKVVEIVWASPFLADDVQRIFESGLHATRIKAQSQSQATGESGRIGRRFGGCGAFFGE